MSRSSVVDDTADHRFVLRQGEDEAELVYHRDGQRLVVVHTGVPEALRGRGIGGLLVAAAVEQARREGLVLVPLCPYARRWLEDHPEAAAGVSIDRPAAAETGRGAPAEEGSRHGR